MGLIAPCEDSIEIIALYPVKQLLDINPIGLITLGPTLLILLP